MSVGYHTTTLLVSTQNNNGQSVTLEQIGAANADPKKYKNGIASGKS